MEFKKYCSIENTDRKKFMDNIDMYFSEEKYTVSEKVDGSNLSLHYDGQEIKVAKRTAFLEDKDGNFNNSDKVVDEIKTKVINLCKDLMEDCEYDVASIILYGEIFGGVYKHPDVEKVDGAVKIQGRVQYSPDNHFYCFDIKINGSYISQDRVELMCQKHGLLYAKALFEGTLEECLKYSNNFQTTIPDMLGLPSIENNNCEGVVIKPINPQFMGKTRVILKNKNEKFKEKSGDRGFRRKRLPRDNTKIYELAQPILAYITENRLRNVISHIGTITDKDFGKLSGMFAKDILDDFEKDSDHLNKLEKDQRRKVNKIIGAEAGKLIRKNFLNIIDNNF